MPRQKPHPVGFRLHILPGAQGRAAQKALEAAAFARWHSHCSSPIRMNVGLYQAAAALGANARWQEMITENLSASAIPGYKKQEISFAAVQAGLLPSATQGVRQFALPRAQTSINFEQGELRYTGLKTDVALEGSGFLEVQLSDGTTAYTRDGELHIDAYGQLVTKQGDPVIGTGGPIQVDLNNYKELSISSTGEVSQGTDLKGQLRVVDFNEPGLLTPITRGNFLSRDPRLQARDASNTTFRQGFLEVANTSPVAEMAEMITAMRAFEVNQRVIQAHDERLGRVVSELGNPT
jgi:flagellar basal-body rod protein FlgF